MIEYPFSIPFFSTYLEQDYLAGLRKDTRYTKSLTQKNPVYKYQGVFNILERYPELRDKLLEEFNGFSYELYGDVYGWKIGTSWITYTGKGDYIHEHGHDNYQWSGVLYFGDKYYNSVPLIFSNPLHKLFTYQHQFKAVNKLTCDWMVNPKPGLLVIFPSFVKHGTVKQQSSEIRYSMAFNIMPTKIIGGDSSLDI